MAEAALSSFEGLSPVDAEAMLELWKEMQNLSSAKVNADGEQTIKSIGGLDWNVISPNDSGVADIGKTAVDKHNSDAGTQLQFVEVVSGLKLHVLLLDLYALVIRVKDGDNIHTDGALTLKAPFQSMKLLFWM